MPERSKLVKMRIVNLGCIGHEGVDVFLDNIVCLVGANNSGKSTVLRAYELAVGDAKFEKETDLCDSVPDGPATVELWVHIPPNTLNIAEKWKVHEDGLLLVRSKWEWSEENKWVKKRFTWDPEDGQYADDGKASGLDAVFNSRLPVPFRIGSLEDPHVEHDKLLTLILQPIADQLAADMKSEGSEIAKAISKIKELANQPVILQNDTISSLKKDLNESHKKIFPDLSIDFEIGVGDISIDPLKLLKNNSHITFSEWDHELSWSQQGTGSQRALFWTMLQVRSELQTAFDIKQQGERRLKELDQKIAKLEKDEAKAKTESTKAKKREEASSLKDELRRIKDGGGHDVAKGQNAEEEIALPGYMLIIDEPETGLHPNAIRAACDYLYSLAGDPSWQVMLATHSPVFINPLQDHTTIVRLDRSLQTPSPYAFRSSSVRFSDDEVENLKMLNRFDQGIAEMFFGQFPVLIEGDTEFAAFESVITKNSDRFPLSRKPLFVRARGKFTMPLIIRMLREFHVPFAILHDLDSPRLENGNQNSAWTGNMAIYKEICEARNQGLRVVHRVSVIDFEKEHFSSQTSTRDKPWRMFNAVQTDVNVEKSVLAVLQELLSLGAKEEPFDTPFEQAVMHVWETWSNRNRVEC